MADRLAPHRPVYIVDDDAAVRQALKFALTVEGFDVSIFSSAADLLRISEPEEIACLVLDYRLPEMNGMELARQMRKRGSAGPVLLITSHPPQELVRRASAEGMRVVEKPLIGSVLTDAVRAAWPV